jgi:hypothetical protein
LVDKYQEYLSNRRVYFLKIHKLKVWTLNLVILLPSTAGLPDRNCVEVINEVFSSHHNLCDQPLAQLDHKLFTDGNSFLKEETRYAGYRALTLNSVLEAQAQKAELIALTRAL